MGISQAVGITEAGEVRTVASTDGVDVGTTGKDTAGPGISAGGSSGGVALLSNSGGGENCNDGSDDQNLVHVGKCVLIVSKSE